MVHLPPDRGSEPLMPWVDEQGVVSETCPNCLHAERELRNYRAKITRLLNEAESAKVAKRDGKVWLEAIEHWILAFPGRRITSKGIKSERATIFFQRLDAGASEQDVRDAVVGAKEFPYIVYGKRTKTGSKSDLAVDLVDVCKHDTQFDFLVEVGRKAREAPIEF